MELNWIDVIGLLLGSGFVLSIVTLVYNWRQSKLENKIQDRREKTANRIQDRREAITRDFEARKDAKEYYMGLYGHIAILDELMQGYQRSTATGKAKVFTKTCQFAELTSNEILKEFKAKYEAFSSFYIKKKCEGYEIYVSNSLKASLIEFWICMQGFNDNNEDLKSEEKVKYAHSIAEKATQHMEDLFGLKENKR